MPFTVAPAAQTLSAEVSASAQERSPSALEQPWKAASETAATARRERCRRCEELAFHDVERRITERRPRARLVDDTRCARSHEQRRRERRTDGMRRMRARESKEARIALGRDRRHERAAVCARPTRIANLAL